MSYLMCPTHKGTNWMQASKHTVCYHYFIEILAQLCMEEKARAHDTLHYTVTFW